MTDLPRTCMIGAGSSGIAAVKALHEEGFEVDCFETSDLLSRVAHGAVRPKPNLARLDGDRVVFTDGTSVQADIVVY